MVTQGKTSEWKIERERKGERDVIVCEVGWSESWTKVEVSSQLSQTLQQLQNSKLTVDRKSRKGALSDKHTNTHKQSVSLSVSRQVDADVLARLQGSSLTPFEPMSQDNSQRFQHYCQHPPPPYVFFPESLFSHAMSEQQHHPLMHKCVFTWSYMFADVQWKLDNDKNGF